MIWKSETQDEAQHTNKKKYSEDIIYKYLKKKSNKVFWLLAGTENWQGESMSVSIFWLNSFFCVGVSDNNTINKVIWI